MPYIPQEDRFALRPRPSRHAQVEGELNFQISALLEDYILANGLSYEQIGDVQGALANAAMEFNRRITAPYEDLKIADNGDVYTGVLEMLATKKRETDSGAPNAQDGTNQEATKEKCACRHGRPECACNRTEQG